MRDRLSNESRNSSKTQQTKMRRIERAMKAVGGRTKELEEHVWGKVVVTGGWCTRETLKDKEDTIKDRSRTFQIRNNATQYAIQCYSNLGPMFGYDLYISDNCNNTTNSQSYFPYYYTESSAMDKRDLLMGAECFSVSAMEVFSVE